MRWLVTGGAGYIGAHVVASLRAAGLTPVVLDDLSSGRRGFLPDDVEFVQGSLLDPAALDEAVGANLTGVIHVAGYKYAGISVERPLHTYEQNVTGTERLLDAMQRHGVDKLVFSSSAAVYGTPQADVERVTEDSPTRPESPYGESKLIGEWLIRAQARATGLAHTSLRYFNVVGSGLDDVADLSPYSLYSLVFQALEAGRSPQIYGNDYPTPDGTCIRDFVHVADLAHSHVVAARRLAAGEPVEPVYNLGSGTGTSVAEIMRAMAEVTGIDFEPEIVARRPGDPSSVVADGTLAARDLEWASRHSVRDTIASAWAARARITAAS